MAFHPPFAHLFLAKLDMTGNGVWSRQWSHAEPADPENSWLMHPRTLLHTGDNTIGVVGTRVWNGLVIVDEDDSRGMILEFEVKPDLYVNPLSLSHDLVAYDGVGHSTFNSAVETFGGGLAIVGERRISEISSGLDTAVQNSANLS